MKRIIILVVVCLVASSAQAYTPDDVLIASDHTSGAGTGHAWIADGADSGGLIPHTYFGGFGPITDSGVQSDGEWIIGTSAGALFRRHPDTLADVNVNVGFGTINTLAVSPNDNVLVGTAEGNVFIRNPDLSSVAVVPGGPFGDVTAIGAQSNNDFVFANAIGQAWRMDSTGANLNFNGAFGAISALAVAPNDNVIIGSPAGNVWVQNPDLSGLQYVGGGFGNIVDIVAQSDNSFAFASDAGNAWVFDSTGTTNTGFVNGLGTLTSLAVQSDDDIVIASSVGNVWIFDPLLTGSKEYEGGLGSPVTLAVQVPEPATLAFLGLGSLFMSRRKKGTR